MIKKILFLHVIFSTLIANEVYTVDELIVKALKNSPDIDISKLDLEASKKRYTQAFGTYLPKVDLQANTTYIDAKETTFLNDAQDTLLSGSLNLYQLLYDFGKTSGYVNASKEITHSYDANLKEQIILKKRDVKIAYYDILKYLALIDVDQENIKLNQAQLKRAKRYFEAGIRTKIDISDAKVRLVKAEIALLNTRYDLQSAYAVLDRVVGFATTQKNYTVSKYDVDFSKDLFALLPTYDLDLAGAIDYAYKNRPELQRLYFLTQAQKEQQKSSYATYYPTLYLQANYLKTDAQDHPNLLNNEQLQAGVYLNWNLFNGGSDRAKRAEAAILTQKSITQEQKIKLAIKEEVTKAYIALNKSKEQVRLSENLLRLSKEKFDQVSKQYEYGLSDYIELQEARQGYIDAKTNLAINYYDYFSAFAVLDATLGR